MLLKIGELAKHSGLTVRALHHYDAIGLLKPSARTDAGYRLYDRNDIARLHQIQALRKFGVALADIGAFLARADLSLPALVARQIDMLTQQIANATRLRERLRQLHLQLQQGQEPDLVDWLTILEQMTMYDKYFSADELQQLPLYAQAETLAAPWRELVNEVTDLMDKGVPASDPAARQLARRWMRMLVRDTAANPVLFAKLNEMHQQEPALQQQTGITPAMMRYIQAAQTATRLAIYRNYLDDQEYAFLAANIDKRADEWPPLIARVRQAVDARLAPDAPEALALAKHWYELFCAFAGHNPQTQQKVRDALMREPELTEPGWVDGAMRDFIRAAMQAMQAKRRAH